MEYSVEDYKTFFMLNSTGEPDRLVSYIEYSVEGYKTFFMLNSTGEPDRLVSYIEYSVEGYKTYYASRVIRWYDPNYST